jgi:serine/threonine-protein kinase
LVEGSSGKVLANLFPAKPETPYLAVTVFATLRLSRTSEPSIPTVAVLPFRHVGDSAGRYFTDGLTEEVTSRLAGLAGLGVISRRSADQYRDDPRPLREIGSELRADYVLEGSVRWTPEGVRVTPRLVRVRDDRSIWDRTLDAEGTEALAVQGRIAGEVAGALQVALSSRERRGVERPATASEAAYDYYLRGNEYFARSNQHDDMAGAEALYTRALEEDPGFAQAQARLARVNVGMYWFGHDRVPERLTRARALIDSALAADPELPEARLALGYWYYWGRRDYPRAIAELERLRRLQPNNGEVLAAMAYVERRMGRWSDAAAHLSAAVALDPRSNARAHDLGDTYLSMRDYDAAERMFQRAIALAPDWPVPYVYYANLQVLRNGDFAAAHAVVQEALRHMSPGRLAGALLMVERTGVSIVTTDTALARQMAAIPLDAFQGDTAWYHLFRADLAHARGDRAATRRHADEARAVFEARLAANPGAFPNHASLGLAHAFAGNRDAALASARRATELLPIAADANSGPFLVSTLARIHVLTGDPAAALPLLARLLQIPSWISPASLQHDPVWEGIRQLPGYREQLRLRQPM